MPDYWQVPTVSMGLGPIQAIYQAQFMKYLEARGLMPKSDRKVWCFLGDGECDEPESLGAISVAGREKLDNLIFVINCNLQRLDGPVRGNGKIIQELGGVFRGAGWNVLKLIWGSYWDPLLARDTAGVLRKLMMETVDGEYQACKAFGGKYTREHFFGKYPETAAMVANLSDEDIWRLDRKSTRLNSSHPSISYAVFCLKKNKTTIPDANFPIHNKVLPLSLSCSMVNPVKGLLDSTFYSVTSAYSDTLLDLVVLVRMSAD